MDKERVAHDLAMLILDKSYDVDASMDDEALDNRREKVLEDYRKSVEYFKKQL
jgi:hypothetical protein